jgi:hypothetical protein
MYTHTHYSAAQDVKARAPTSTPTTHLTYTPTELDCLALMFTLVKILFVCGGVQCIPALCAVIEPLRVGQELHLTSIRNEHAYYRYVLWSC